MRRGLLALLLAAACGGSEGASAPGVRFDPTAVVPGDRVGDLIVDSVSIQQPGGAGWIGMVQFRGELLLGGHASYPPGADSSAVCFESDSVSAQRMPRAPGDRGPAIFCFTNPRVAAKELGPGSRPSTIVVDHFTVRRGETDGLNRARLLRLVARDG